MKKINLETLEKVYKNEISLKVEETREVTWGYGTATEVITINYFVEEINKHLVYEMGHGWVLKDNLSDREHVTLKDYFDKDTYDQEQKDKQEKNETIEELKEMSNTELLEACGGDEVLRKLENDEMAIEDAYGDYKYKSQTVLSISKENGFVLYFADGGRDKIINYKLDYFMRLVHGEEIKRV